jgi:hypothetical protein
LKEFQVTKRAWCLLVLFGASPLEATAEPIIVTSAAFSTSGVFSCLQRLSCSGEGTSSMTLHAGDESVTFRFAGVDISHAVRNVADPVPIGRFDVDATSADFLFPTGSNDNKGIVQFVMTVTHTQPISNTKHVFWRFGPGGGSTLSVIGQSYFSISSGLADYSGIVYSISPHPFALPANGSVELAAEAGAVPEPASLLLAATGLAAALRRRLKKAPLH